MLALFLYDTLGSFLPQRAQRALSEEGKMEEREARSRINLLKLVQFEHPFYFWLLFF
ncbi:hypothetical protein IQ269_26140 [Tychonema sp. LEGE 07199]|uniref:hypothetical protein n=1 Tax=unclassified Tychonema TaxID=2642144 RepID=UPI00188249AD|nr:MULTISPECIES: hypothetical protein [unclassified Tychonema]MBE9124184.1 hypothetical protein [Tychonema sp. LEGE 07199]MBE9132756.1 hypothetical protein [Tychonema sp. LEGE 07196]